MIVVIIAIAFIGVLLSIIMVSSAAGYRMRVVDQNSKSTFYEADAVLDEIYNGLGQNCYDALSAAYIETSTGLVDSTTGAYITNEKLNAAMKETYLDLVIGTISENAITDVDSISSSVALRTKVVDHIEDMVVKAVGTNSDVTIEITLNGVSYSEETIVLEELTVKCTSKEYFSSVTTDINLQYPGTYVSFIKEGNTETNYLDYALIGMTEVKAGKLGSTDGVSQIDRYGFVSLTGSMYAGNLTVWPGSTFSMTDGTLINSADTHLHTAVGTSESYASSLTLAGVKVWTKNIFLGEESTGSTGNGATLTAKASQKSPSVFYVQDDTTLNGDYASFAASGNVAYYGYTPSGSYSSAIIVNGLHANVNLSLNDLYLAGTAQISDTGYQTLDSVGIKGMQELYMIPAKYLDLSENPSLVTSRIENVDLTSFYAYRLGLVENSADCETNADNKTRYYYFNFTSALAQRSFLTSVITYNATAGTYSYLNPSTGAFETVSNVDEETAADLKLLRASLTNCINKFGYVGLTMTGNTDTAGTITSILGSSASVSAGSNTIDMEKLLKYGSNVNSVSEYYQIMREYLAYDANYVLTNSDIYHNMLDVTRMATMETTIYNRDYDNDASTGKDGKEQVIAFVTGSNYTVPSDYTSGLIVAYDCDVILNHDFDGLIVTNGTIYLYESVTITADRNLLVNILEDNYSTYKNVARLFYAYVQSGDELTLENPAMSDMIYYKNWRKNDVN